MLLKRTLSLALLVGAMTQFTHAADKSTMQTLMEKASDLAQQGSEKATQLYNNARSIDTTALYNQAMEQGKNLYTSATNVTLDDVKAVATQGSTKACELYKQALVKGKDVYTSARNLTLADVQNFAQTSKDSLVVAVQQTPAKAAELYNAAQQLTLADAMNFAQENKTSLAVTATVGLGLAYWYMRKPAVKKVTISPEQQKNAAVNNALDALNVYIDEPGKFAYVAHTNPTAAIKQQTKTKTLVGLVFNDEAQIKELMDAVHALMGLHNLEPKDVQDKAAYAERVSVAATKIAESITKQYAELLK